jgi:hypothetical protein
VRDHRLAKPKVLNDAHYLVIEGNCARQGKEFIGFVKNNGVYTGPSQQGGENGTYRPETNYCNINDAGHILYLHRIAENAFAWTPGLIRDRNRRARPHLISLQA